MTPRTVITASLVSVAGLAMLGGSAVLLADDAGWDDWWSGLLVEAGGAVFFFLPLYLLTRSLDRHIEDVREQTVSKVEQVRKETVASVDQVRAATKSSVEALTERVSAFQGDFERRLDDIAARVSSRLAEERRQDTELFDVLCDDPTRDRLIQAIERADELGLITTGNPRHAARVAAAEPWGLYLCPQVSGSRQGYDEPELSVDIRHVDGTYVEAVEWPDCESVEDVMVRLSQAVYRETGGQVDVHGFFEGLSDLLKVASSSPDLRPIVQLCPPSWAVTARGVATYDRNDAIEVLGMAQVEHQAKSMEAGGDARSLALYVAMSLIIRDPWRLTGNEPPF